MPNAFAREGLQPSKPTRYAALSSTRFFSGLWTNRSPLRDAAVPDFYEKYGMGRYESIIDGLNTELTARLTLARRPGLSVYNSQSFTSPNSFYSFHTFAAGSTGIRVVCDTPTTVYDATGPSTKTALFTKSTGAGQAYFQSVGNQMYFGDGVDTKKWVWSTTSWVANTAFTAYNPSTGVTAQYITDPNGNIQQVTTSGTTGSTQPTWATSAFSTTTDGTVTWTCRGSYVQNWGVFPPTTAPTVTPPPSSGERFWQPNTTLSVSPVPYSIMDSNGNVEILVTAGTTGATYPTWNKTSSTGLTVDGSAQWRNCGGLLAWQPNFGFPSYACMVDPVGNLQIASAAHGTQATASDVTGYFVPNGNSGSYTFVVIAYFADGTHTGSSQPITVNCSHFTLVWNPVANVDHYKVFCTAASGGSATIGAIQGAGERNAGSGPIFPPSTTSIYLDNGSWYPYHGDGTSPPTNNTSGNITGLYQQTGTSQPTFATTVGGTTYDAGPVQPGITWTCYGPAQRGIFGGYGYGYCFHTVTGHVSSMSPAINTGPAFGASFVTNLSGSGSPDSQVDAIWLFRTVDGGATYLFDAAIANPGNTTWNYTDNTIDSALDELIQAPLSPFNNPPPLGAVVPCYHQGRVWVAVNNVVYASGGPDVLTGNGSESFPPANSFTFPSHVVKMQPYAQGMLIFTTSDIYVILGQGAITNFYPVPLLQGYGLLSYNSFDTNGSVYHFFSTDGQLITLDPNVGVSDEGFPIGDLISSWNPSLTYVAYHAAGSADKATYLADGSTGWFRLNRTPAPETGLTWSPKATITGGCKAVQSIEVTPGIHRLLVGPSSSGPILQRDYGTYADNGTPYSAYATMGNITLAPHGEMAGVVFIGVDAPQIANGSPPIVSVLLDEISGPFEILSQFTQDPPNQVPSSTIYGLRYYLSQSQQSAWCRHLQLKIAWPAENTADELYGCAIYGSVYSEK